MESPLRRPPLQDATKQIRLMKIQQDGSHDRRNVIKCTMTVHNLADVVGRYVAISYTWGSKGQAKVVVVNGHRYSVRPNCWNALKQMKLHRIKDYCFVDSLCIDQDSHREKREQVGQMGSIYSQARMVAACLGPRATDHKASVRLFKANMLYAYGARKDLLEMFQHISEREYFARVWTIQECILAREVELFYGISRASLHDFRWKLRQNRKSFEQSTSLLHLLAFLDDCGNQSSPSQTPETKTRLIRCHWQPLLPADAILRYAFRACEDPRDKVFGLHSLMISSAQERISIDYERPLWNVLLDYIGVHDNLLDSGARHAHDEARQLKWELEWDSANDQQPTIPPLGNFMLSIRVLAHQFALASRDFRVALEDFYTRRISNQGSSSTVCNDGKTVSVGLCPVRCHKISTIPGESDTLVSSETVEKMLEQVGLCSVPKPGYHNQECNQPDSPECTCGHDYLPKPFPYFGDSLAHVKPSGPAGLDPGSKPYRLLHTLPGRTSTRLAFQVPAETTDGDILLSFGSSPIFSTISQEQPETPGAFAVCRKSTESPEYGIVGLASRRAAFDIHDVFGNAPSAYKKYSYGLEQRATITCEDILESSLPPRETLLADVNTSSRLNIAALAVPAEHQYPQLIREMEQRVAHLIGYDALQLIPEVYSDRKVRPSTLDLRPLSSLRSGKDWKIKLRRARRY